jgi:hypothetical protein
MVPTRPPSWNGPSRRSTCATAADALPCRVAALLRCCIVALPRRGIVACGGPCRRTCPTASAGRHWAALGDRCTAKHAAAGAATAQRTLRAASRAVTRRRRGGDAAATRRCGPELHAQRRRQRAVQRVTHVRALRVRTVGTAERCVGVSARSRRPHVTGALTVLHGARARNGTRGTPSTVKYSGS